MTQAFDNRLVTLGILIDGENITYDQSFYILASGTKYTDGSLGECNIRIDNIAQQTRDLLITKSSPFNINQRTFPTITLDVGRQSYGTFRLFQGNGIASNPSQPPDISLTLRSLTGSMLLGNVIASTLPTTCPLQTIAQQVANDLSAANQAIGGPAIILDFQATNRNISNYSFSGPTVKQVAKLNQLGGIRAFVDNNKLRVLDSGQPNRGTANAPIQINARTGMVGVPEITELGVRVRCLIINQINVADQIQITSVRNPAANGNYTIYKLGFELASRDTPFYWIIEAQRFSLAATQ